jgi:low affinity Fe/Cu permease
MKEMFNRVARATASAVGSPWAFLVAVVFTLTWAVTGPRFGYSDGWQLVVNTVSSIVTFLMVFLIQATQNRDMLATQLKLDELLRAVEGARVGLINLEELSDEDLMQLEQEFARLRSQPNPHDGAKTGLSEAAAREQGSHGSNPSRQGDGSTDASGTA